MKRFFANLEFLAILKYFFRWLVLLIPVAFFVGSLIALFLYLLDLATEVRWANPYLLWFLPLAGVLIYLAYRFMGKNAEAGNNLIMDEIHKPGGGIPLRMAPLVLISTVVTHLFGGSAGREGTAVQIGGSLAQFFAKKMHLSKEDTRILLMSGIAAGFGAVFGAPVAGTIFALEVLSIGRVKYDALLPCFIAAVLADMVCMAYGIEHTLYRIVSHEQVGIGFSYFSVHYLLVAKVLLAGIAFGLVSYLFSELSHAVKAISNRFIQKKILIPLLGGLVVIGLTLVLGTSDYLGLGVTTASGKGNSIVNAFIAGEIDSFAWFWKLIFTSITLSMGFKGGEVTPLFFIGALLGNTLAVLLGAPIDLLAALGFIAVFAGATNTPIACTIMGAELFGGEHIFYYALACFMAYFFSGNSGIYASQRIEGESKTRLSALKIQHSLKSIREKKRIKNG